MTKFWEQIPRLYDFPLGKAYEEAMQVYPKALSRVRDKSPEAYSDSKWKGITLRGEGWDVLNPPRGNKEMKWTKISEECPVISNWVQSYFNFFPYIGRVRFNYLEPGGRLGLHQDNDEWATQISIHLNVPRDYSWRFFESKEDYPDKFEQVPLVPGVGFIMETRALHELINDSEQVRINLIIDGPLALRE